MSKKESSFLNMLVTLLIITIIAGLSLGFINEVTKKPKAKAKLERKIKALKLVLPEFTNNPVKDIILVKSEKVKDSIEIYPALNNNKKVGKAIVGSSNKGFSGLIKLIVGFRQDGVIQDIVVLEQKETPGLGTKMKDEKYLKQYREKNPTNYNLKVKKDGGQIDALTGATISSRAFSEAVLMAHGEFMKVADK